MRYLLSTIVIICVLSPLASAKTKLINNIPAPPVVKTETTAPKTVPTYDIDEFVTEETPAFYQQSPSTAPIQQYQYQVPQQQYYYQQPSYSYGGGGCPGGNCPR